jgi:cob(I)alamin adenosyltransferase
MLVQFLKNGRSGELAAMRSIPRIHVLTGPANTLFTNMMDARQKASALEQHQRHLALAARAAKAGQLDMLVLDEVLDAVQTGLLPEPELLAFLRDKPPALEVLLTGRNPSDELLALADYISEVRSVRHPWDQGIKAREGVEY